MLFSNSCYFLSFALLINFFFISDDGLLFGTNLSTSSQNDIIRIDDSASSELESNRFAITDYPHDIDSREKICKNTGKEILKILKESLSRNLTSKESVNSCDRTVGRSPNVIQSPIYDRADSFELTTINEVDEGTKELMIIECARNVLHSR